VRKGQTWFGFGSQAANVLLRPVSKEKEKFVTSSRDHNSGQDPCTGMLIFDISFATVSLDETGHVIPSVKQGNSTTLFLKSFRDLHTSKIHNNTLLLEDVSVKFGICKQK